MREIHIECFIIKLNEFHIGSAIMLKIRSCNICSICKTKSIAKIFAEVAVANWSSNCLVVLLFHTQSQLMPVIRNSSKVSFLL